MNLTNANQTQFLKLLVDFNPEALWNDHATIYGLWPDLTLAYTNLEWSEFWKRNGGGAAFDSEWALGKNILDAIADPLKPFFIKNFARCFTESKPWEHLFECSSPDLYRYFHMTTYPLGQSEGLLVVNSLRRESDHTRTPCPPLNAMYKNSDGIVTQCCHCRRIRHIAELNEWDWVPDWVAETPSNVSHSLCQPCFGYHYSENPGSFAESFLTGN